MLTGPSEQRLHDAGAAALHFRKPRDRRLRGFCPRRVPGPRSARRRRGLRRRVQLLQRALLSLVGLWRRCELQLLVLRRECPLVRREGKLARIRRLCLCQCLRLRLCLYLCLRLRLRKRRRCRPVLG